MHFQQLECQKNQHGVIFQKFLIFIRFLTDFFKQIFRKMSILQFFSNIPHLKAKNLFFNLNEKNGGGGRGGEVGQISLWKSRTSKTTIFAVFRLWTRIDHQNFHEGTPICHFVLELVSFPPDWTPKTAKNLEISWKITNYKNINFDDKSLSSAS